MQWIEPGHSPRPRAKAFAELARMAAEHDPDSPWSILAQANAAFSGRDYERTIELLESAASIGFEAHLDWPKLTRSYLETGRPEEALRACNRGFVSVDKPGYDLSMQAGFTHLILRDVEEAKQHFLAAAELGNVHEACWNILREPALAKDASAIFAMCDELEERFGASTVFTANRALAYSVAGDERSAAQLVDLDKHVRIGHISEFFAGDIRKFNAALTREAIEIADGVGSTETAIVPTPDISKCPMIQSLQTMVRVAIETYLGEADERGLDRCLPLPLEKATLTTGVTLLRRDGRNGQHIHVTSAISAVYHVENPAKNSEHTGAGALKIGPADEYTGGHAGCWGERRVLPQPGQLTIFPAHFFHDVIPTGTGDLRISFPSDVLLSD